MTKKKAKRKTKPIISYNDIICDSEAEKWILFWLFELKEAGYIESIERAKSYKLTDSVSHQYEKKLKTKTIIKNEVILLPCSYSPDFFIKLTEKGKKLDIFRELGSYNRLKEKGKITFIHIAGEALIEVKGTQFRHSQDTTEKFKVEQKWLWQEYGLYVNLVQPDKLFPLTFTPEKFKYTEKKKQLRKLRWKSRNLEEFLKEIK